MLKYCRLALVLLVRCNQRQKLELFARRTIEAVEIQALSPQQLHPKNLRATSLTIMSTDPFNSAATCSADGPFRCRRGSSPLWSSKCHISSLRRRVRMVTL
eukprot:scaffold117863_cov18-Prasinocladus_malaysianus.AAC.1